MNNKLTQLLTEENAEYLSNYIVEIFGNTDEEPNPVKLLDYDFHLSKGVMLDNKAANTSFSFDLPNENKLYEIFVILGDEKEVLDEEDNINLQNFSLLVAEKLQNKELKDKITRAVFKRDDLKPVLEFKVKHIYLNVKPVLDWTLTLHKKAAKTKEEIDNCVKAYEIMKICAEENKDPEQVIRENKEAGNERYNLIESFVKNKAFYDIDVVLWVNYSNV